MVRLGQASGEVGEGGAAWRRYLGLCAAPLAVAVAAFSGCQPQGSSTGPPRRGEADRVNAAPDLLYSAVNLLRGAEESGSAETVNSALARLNQWVASNPPLSDWRSDPLIETLPPQWRKLPPLGNLAELRFLPADGYELRQIVWLHDASEHAAGEQNDALARATRLFDWTVRNIQLETAGEPAIPRTPVEIMLLGRGRANDRAWIFALLARQQGLDVVMLARPGAEKAAPQDLLPALLADGELCLFDPTLGMPLPGPDGTGVATLKQVAQDETLLRRLDLDAEHAYPLKAADFQQVVAQVEASPIYLAERSQLVESELAGKQHLTLSVQPTKLAERLKSIEQVKDVGLWPLPYERFVQFVTMDEKTARAKAAEMSRPPLLWQARVQHLLGNYTGAEGAIATYQQVRPSEQEMQAMLADQRVPPANRTKLEAAVGLMKAAKGDASYWLGLVAFERNDHKTAIDYFQKRTLDATPKGPWTAAARYNLGRTYEAQGKWDEAVHQYEAGQSPQRHGNLLRARKLKQ